MVRNIIKQSLFFIVFSLGILFFFPISAKASTTGFPDDWTFTVNEDSIDLEYYSGSSNTVIIEGPIEYEGKSYKVYWNGNVAAQEVRTRGHVYPTEHLVFGYVIETLDLRCFDTSSLNDMSSMFYGCDNLRTLYLGGYFDTSSVTDMSNMFANCFNLTSLDLSSFNTSNVTNMYNMFQCCTSLRSLDLRSFDTTKVEDMQGMFSFCSNLENLDLSSFEVAYTCRTTGLLDGCLKLKSVDLSGFDLQGSEYSIIYADGVESLRTIVTPRNVSYLELPAVFVKEDETWVGYSTIWKDSSGKQYTWRYPDSGDVAVQSTTLTYVGVESQGYTMEGYQQPNWIVEGTNSGGYNSGRNLPNTDASDFRRIIMLIFLLSLVCSMFTYKIYRKFN